MSDNDLIERVARWMCDQSPYSADDWRDYVEDAMSLLRAIDLPGQREAAARAALEAAAREGDKYAAWHNQHDDGLSGFDHMALGASEVTDAIRAIDPAAFR